MLRSKRGKEELLAWAVAFARDSYRGTGGKSQNPVIPIYMQIGPYLFTLRSCSAAIFGVLPREMFFQSAKTTLLPSVSPRKGPREIRAVRISGSTCWVYR